MTLFLLSLFFYVPLFQLNWTKGKSVKIYSKMIAPTYLNDSTLIFVQICVYAPVCNFYTPRYIVLHSCTEIYSKFSEFFFTSFFASQTVFSSISVSNLCPYVSVSTFLMGSGRGAEWGAETIDNLGERVSWRERMGIGSIKNYYFQRHFYVILGSGGGAKGSGWVVRKSAFNYIVQEDFSASFFASLSVFSSISVSNLCLYVYVSTYLMGSGNDR